MDSFSHHTPELRIHQGPQSLTELGRELERWKCRRAIVFCGRTLSKPGGALEQVSDALGARLAAAFCGVAAHSPSDSVEEGARMILQSRADAVVALGGGSAMVTARAAGILAAEGKPLESLCTRVEASGAVHSPRLSEPKLPQFVVPTTPSTACVKAGSGVHDGRTGRRLALFDPKTRARAICIDPALLSSAPVSLVQGAALNALAMAVEGLESAQGDPLSDALLMHALRLLAMHLPQLAARPDDPGLRAQLVLAALMCGQGTDYAGGGLASVLGHAIGVRCKVANGVVNALVLPHTMEFNRPATDARLWKIAGALAGAGGRESSAFGDAVVQVRSLVAALGLPARLRDVGLEADTLDEVVRAAQDDFFLGRNPRKLRGAGELKDLVASIW